MDSDKIVAALWHHDPAFVEFSKSELGVATPEEAWEILYTPYGISKMNPDAAAVHVNSALRSTGKKVRPTGSRREVAPEELRKLFDPLKISRAVIPGQRATGAVRRGELKAQIKQSKKQAKTVHPIHQAGYKQQTKQLKTELRATPRKPKVQVEATPPAPPVGPPPTGAVTPVNTSAAKAPGPPPTGAPGEKKKINWKKPALIGGAAAATAGGVYYGGKKIKQNASGQYPQPPQEEFGYSSDFRQTFDIVKADDKHQVFGWASIIEKNGEPVLDKQGDLIEADELENSAYKFVIESRKGGRQHKRNELDLPIQVSDMIESFVMTNEKKEAMGLPLHAPTGWWVGFKVNDEDTWRAVKNGEVTSFSIHGRGRRVPMGS